MNKKAILFALVCVCLGLTACGGDTKNAPVASTETEEMILMEDEIQEEVEEETEEAVGAINPWTDCSGLKEAEKIAGFEFSFAESIGEGTWTAYEFRAMEGTLDVNYSCEDLALGIRQTPGEGQDISGDYNDYTTTNTIEDCGTTITLCGEDDIVCLTIFSFNGYSYAIYTMDGDLAVNICQIISEMTGVASTTVENYEPEEGAPYIAEGRQCAEDEVLYGDLSGSYESADGTKASVSIYTSMDEDTLEVGNIVIMGADGQEILSGNLIPIATNLYEIEGTSGTLSVYYEGDALALDYYSDKEHVDYYVMTEHWES